MASVILLLSISLSSLGLVFNFFIVIAMIRYHSSHRKTHQSRSRLISLLYSLNTYVHLSGILLSLLVMSSHSLLLQGRHDRRFDQFSSSSLCYFLSYSLFFFAAGVYGSCFLQALFRFCRIQSFLPRSSKNISFHRFLILFQWILTKIFILPSFFYSIYIPADHLCFIAFDHYKICIYIAFITVVIPVTGTLILYLKVVHYIRRNVHFRQQKRKQIERDLIVLRRILILMIVIIQTSSSGLFLWFYTFLDPSLDLIFYRLLRLVIISSMLICSFTLFLVSPQLKRIFR